MSVARVIPKRIRDQQDADMTPGSGTDGYAIVYNHTSGKFELGTFDAAGAAAAAVAVHVAASDPHTQYALESALGTMATATETAYLLASGSRTGATAQRQVFTSGITAPSWRPASDSTTALQLQNAAGTAFFYGDTTNQRIGIKTNAPVGDLSITQTNGGVGLYMQRGSNSLGGTGYIFRLQANGGANDLWTLDTKGNVASVGTYAVSPVSNNAGTLFSVGNVATLNNTYPAFAFRNYYTTGSAGSMLLIGGKTDSSGARFTALDIAPHINQSGTNGFSIVRVSPYLAATGSGTKNLLDVGINTAADGGGTHTTVLAIDNAGKLKTNQATTNTNTPSGATAKQLPIYDVAGTLLGYIPIYASAW